LRTARKLQRSGDRRPTMMTRLLCRVSSDSVGGMTVWTIRPRNRPVATRVVYLHGGGYVHPLTVDYWRLVRALTSSPAEVIVPGYPLAPDATVDDVLPRLLALEEQTDSHLPTVLMGDSAGGALAIVIAQQMRARRPAPAGVVALCPWLDATLDEEAVADLESTDPMLAESGLRAAGRWWAGTRSPADPVVSPLAGELDGLPPVDVFIGDHDILRPAVNDLARRAQRVSLDLHVHEVSAMFHVWMTRLIPEGRRTRRQLSHVVEQRTREFVQRTEQARASRSRSTRATSADE
ncbi:MAG: alpha/beta hydrolase fold domain-containing protein, partial [Nocardioidaceae bacterium]